MFYVNIARGTTDPWVDTTTEVAVLVENIATRWRHLRCNAL